MSAAGNCVAHIDVNYFFAQVEELRLGLQPNSRPLGVQQNHEVASTNYAARKFGLYNRISVSNARHRCPSLILVRGDNGVNAMQRYRAKSQAILGVVFAALDKLENPNHNKCPHRVERPSFDDFYVGLPLDIESKKAHDWAVSLRSSILASTGLATSVGLGRTKILANLATEAAKKKPQWGVHRVFGSVEEECLLLGAKISSLKGAGLAGTALPPSTRKFLTTALGNNTTLRDAKQKLKDNGSSSVALREIQAFLQSAANGGSTISKFEPPKTLSVECSVRKNDTEPATSIVPIHEGYDKLAKLLLSRAKADEKVYGKRKPSKLIVKWKFYPGATSTRQTQIPFPSSCPQAGQLASLATEAFQKSQNGKPYAISRVVLSIAYATTKLAGDKRKTTDESQQCKLPDCFFKKRSK